jgi:hypothetical protein
LKTPGRALGASLKLFLGGAKMLSKLGLILFALGTLACVAAIIGVCLKFEKERLGYLRRTMITAWVFALIYQLFYWFLEL